MNAWTCSLLQYSTCLAKIAKVIWHTNCDYITSLESRVSSNLTQNDGAIRLNFWYSYLASLVISAN